MKTTKIIVLAMVAGICAASCTKNTDIEVPAESSNLTKASFTAIAEDQVKLGLNGTTPFWQNGDQMAIFQYGKYKTGTLRDSTRSIFTTDGTGFFTGNIVNYKPKEDGGDANTFYAMYPASSNLQYSASTTSSTFTVARAQTGLLADAGKHMIFKGWLKESGNTTYDPDMKVITFNNPFTLSCVTPVIKVNVPAALCLTRIVLSAAGPENQKVGISGNYKSRITKGNGNWIAPKDTSTITIERNGDVISGDVYIVIAPDTNDGSKVYSSATSLSFSLTNSKGWTSGLKVNISNALTEGKIKTLKAFPSSIKWTVPAGYAITSIGTNRGNDNENAPIPILVGTDADVSLKYSSCAFEDDTTVFRTLAEPVTDYTNDGIMTYKLNQDQSVLSFGANFSKFKLSYSNELYYTCRAYHWKLNSIVGFGNYVNNTYTPHFTPVVGTKIPADGSYLYGLSLEYFKIGDPNREGASDTWYKVYVKNPCIYLFRTSGAYSSGTLSFKVPETGTACMFFDALTGKDKTCSITISRNGELETSVPGLTNSAANFKSETFTVAKDDIITIYSTNILGLYSMSFVWFPENQF